VKTTSFSLHMIPIPCIYSIKNHKENLFNSNLLFPMTVEDLLLKDKMAYDEMDRLIMNRLNEVFQKKSFDLKKESKLAAALSKGLLCNIISCFYFLKKLNFA